MITLHPSFSFNCCKSSGWKVKFYVGCWLQSSHRLKSCEQNRVDEGLRLTPGSKFLSGLAGIASSGGRSINRENVTSVKTARFRIY